MTPGLPTVTIVLDPVSRNASVQIRDIGTSANALAMVMACTEAERILLKSVMQPEQPRIVVPAPVSQN